MSAPVESGHHRALAVGLVMATSLVAFETTALLTALPTISEELDGDWLYGATLASYMLADIVGLVIAGSLIDRRGPRIPFVLSIATFVIGLGVAAAANSMLVILLGRVLQGAGAGGLAPISYSTINRAWPEAQRARLFAWISAAWVLPSLVAPALAGWLTSAISWRWVFIGIVPLALATAFLAVPALGRIPPTGQVGTGGPRVLLALRLAGGVGAFTAGIQSSRPLVAIGLVVVGLALAVPAYNSMAPRGIWRARRGLPAILACRTLATAAFLGVDSFVPLAADRVHGSSATVQGFVIIGAALAWSLGSALASRFRERDLTSSARSGFVLIAIGIVATIPVLSADWPLLVTFFTWSVAGLGMGTLFVPTSVAAMSYAEPGRDGTIGSQINLADSLGFGLMGAIGGATVAASDRTSWPLVDALGTNFAIAVGLALVGVVASRGVKRPA
ncbi:MAG: MFS transporter [Actinomycetota bacterium]